MAQDPLLAPDVKDTRSHKVDPFVAHIKTFKTNAGKIVNRELPAWRDGIEMYLESLNPFDDLVNLYNPTLIFDIVQRVLDQYALAPVTIRIPGESDESEQVVRDAVRTIKKRSGLIAGLRDDPKGGLNQLLIGAAIPWWGLKSEEDINKADPIKFQFLRLSQAFFSSNATMIRMPNGDNDANEGLLVFEFPKNELNSKYPRGRKGREVQGSAEDATEGKLSFIDTGVDPSEEQFDTDEENQMTQEGHFYNLDKGIYLIYVGGNDELVEKYDDNDPKLPDYPHKLDGKNILPVELLGTFKVPNQLYPKGLFHKFGKIARNDARRRNSAHRYMDSQVDPDRFIEMEDEDFGTFQGKLEEAQMARQQGLNSWVQVNQGEKPIFSDNRTAPLDGAFERMKSDTLDLVSQGGVAIQDVDRPTSESATATAAEELAKTRLASQIIKSNAQASVTMTRVIIEAIKLIPFDNQDIVPTDATVEAETAEGKTEGPITTVTFGRVSKLLNEKEAFIEEDLSQYDSLNLEFRNAQLAMQIGAGTLNQASAQQKLLGLLGQKVTKQDLQPIPQELTPPSNANSPQLAGLSGTKTQGLL